MIKPYMKKHNCDNCGAPIEIGYTAKCEWCKTPYIMESKTGPMDDVKDNAELIMDLQHNHKISIKKQIEKAIISAMIGGGGDTGAR